MSIDDIERRFAPEEFTLESTLYVHLIEEMIPIGRRDGFSTEFIELMERLVNSLYDCDLPRTCHSDSCRLSAEARSALFDLVAPWWHAVRTQTEGASILTILSALIPHPGVREWMRARAAEESGSLSEYLSDLANSTRDTYML